MRKVDLPELPGRGAVAEELLSSEERAAVPGGNVDPYDWLRAAGRILRSPAVDLSTRRAAELACPGILDEGLLAQLRARLDVEIAAVAEDLEAWTASSPDPGEAWNAISERDDLESVAVALGTAVFAADPGAASADRLEALERLLVERLVMVDDAFDRVESVLLPALRSAPRDPLRARLVAVGVEREDHFWGVWMVAAERMLPEWPRPTTGRPTHTVHPHVPLPVLLSASFRSGAAMPRAATEDVALDQIAAADAEPLAELFGGRVLVRARGPRPDEHPEDVITGLVVVARPPSSLADAWIEATGRRVDSVHVPGIARWISLSELGAATEWTLCVKTSDGAEERVPFRFVVDDSR